MRLRRGRAGRLLGLALAYGWVSFPYTLFPLMTNANDGLISMLRRLCAARALVAARARRADRARERPRSSRRSRSPRCSRPAAARRALRSWISFSAVFALVCLLTVVPVHPRRRGLAACSGTRRSASSSTASRRSASGARTPASTRCWRCSRSRSSALGVLGRLRPAPARRAPGRGARRRRADRDAGDRDPLVLPLHRVVRARSCWWRCSASTRPPAVACASRCPQTVAVAPAAPEREQELVGAPLPSLHGQRTARDGISAVHERLQQLPRRAGQRM